MSSYINNGGVKASLLCVDHVESLCEKGLESGREKNGIGASLQVIKVFSLQIRFDHFCGLHEFTVTSLFI